MGEGRPPYTTRYAQNDTDKKIQSRPLSRAAAHGMAGQVTASKRVRSQGQKSRHVLRWSDLVCPLVPIPLPARGTAQQVANSSREGTTRRRFRLGGRISQPLSEFALLGSMDLPFKLPHTAGPNCPDLRGPMGRRLGGLPQFFSKHFGSKAGDQGCKNGGDRNFSWAVV